MAKATSRKCLWIGRKYSKYLAANSFFQLYQVWIPRSELLFWGMANSNNIWKVNCLVFVYVKSSYSHGVLQRSCFENFKNIQEANRWNRLFSRKNLNRGVEDILFWKPPRIFYFLLYPWKFQTKQSSTPGYSTKLCEIPWKLQGQKERPLEIPHYFSWPSLEIPLRF